MSSLFALFCISISFISNTCGSNVYWTGDINGGAWEDSSNWNTNLIPTINDDVILDQSYPFVILINSTVQIRSLALGNSTVCAFRGCNCSHTISITNSSSLLVTENITVNNFGRIVLWGENATVSAPSILLAGIINGNGIINGSLQLIGSSVLDPYDFKTVRPSTPIVLTINGNLTVGAQSTIVFDVQSPTIEFDNVQVNGNIAFSGTQTTIGVNYFGAQNESIDNFFLLYATGNITGRFGTIAAYIIPYGMLDPPSLCPYSIYAGSSTRGPPVPGDRPCQSANNGAYSVILQPTQICCNTGWTGSNCDVPLCTNQCSGRGVCEATGDPNTIPPVCICDEGWQGTSCAIADCPGNPDCSRHGSCDSSLSVPKCVCNGHWDGEDCSQGICPGSPQCSGNGNCFIDIAVPVCNCSVGFQGLDCSEMVKQNECPNNCSGHGTCQNGVCVCQGPWTLSDCSVPKCSGGTSCSFRGECTANETTAYCSCNSGWTGDNCNQAVCKNDCSGSGVCVDTTVTPQCDCDFGRGGDDCSLEIKTNEEKEDFPTGAVIGAVVAGVFVVTVGVVAVVLYQNKKRKQEEQDLVPLENRTG